MYFYKVWSEEVREYTVLSPLPYREDIFERSSDQDKKW